MTSDGGGRDGRYNTYLADRTRGVELVDRTYRPTGLMYGHLGRALSEIAKGPCYTLESNVEGWEQCQYISGKKMGYAALGRVREDWVSHIEDMYFWRKSTWAAGLLGPSGGSLEEQRDFAATSQEVFMRISLRHIAKWLAIYPGVEGLVLSGGCALNVPTNTEAKRRFQYPVYVPAAPHDGGLSVGGAWLYRAPPPGRPSALASVHADASLAFAGPMLWDSPTGSNLLQAEAARRGAVNVGTTPADVGVIAGLLADGNVIAVVRGGSEYGPRALGHRSLLADPTQPEAKAKMNRLKVREWWRPVAPMVAYEAVDALFEQRVWSPFMSFAPRLRPGIAEALPAIAHFDGTARCQTVTAAQDPWLHALLMAMQGRNGFAVLCNTSFNVRGRPIINRLDESLRLLDVTTDLDYLYVDGWLFRKQLAKRKA